MPMRIERVRYGHQASEALRDALARAKAGDPLAPVTVIVPSNHVGVAARRLLASGRAGAVCESGSGIAAISFLTVYRLADLLGTAALSAERHPVSTPAIAAALRAALQEDPGVFRAVAAHPATETALVESYRELRDLSPESLARLASHPDPRTADVARLCANAHARLQPGWYDEEDLLEAASSAVLGDADVTGMLGPVVVHLPERLSQHAARLIASLAGVLPVTVLAGTTGDERADAETERVLARLVVATADTATPRSAASGSAASGSAVSETSPVAPVDADAALMRVTAERTTIVSASDPEEEVRSAVRTVIDLARSGTRLDRLAILYATRDPYARSLHDQLGEVGIPANGPAVVPLSARVAGRALLGYLRLADHDVDFRRDAVLSWLAGSPVHTPQGRPVPVAAWERASRAAGVVAGRGHWDERLVHYAREHDKLAAEAAADPDAEPWREDRHREAAAHARELRAFALDAFDALIAAASGTRPWSTHARWARQQLGILLGADAAQPEWPAEEVAALQKVERALDRLDRLDAIEPSTTLEVFARTLAVELSMDHGREGSIGHGVFCGPISMGAGLDLDAVVILGLAEGSCPTPVRDDTLLPERARSALGDELAPAHMSVERQHRDLLAAIASSDRLVLSFPRGDLRRNRDRAPSRWLLRIAERLARAPLRAEDLLGPSGNAYPWIRHVASFEAGLRSAAFPATEQEHRLCTLLHLDDRETGSARASLRDPATLGDPILSTGAEMLQARGSDAFTRFDGNLAGLDILAPTAAPVSATALERWVDCPFAYFMKDLLRVDPVENPEDELRITPLVRGRLVHEILEQFIAEVVESPDTPVPEPDDAWTEADERRMLQIAATLFERYESEGLTGRPLFWNLEKRRIRSDLSRFLSDDGRRRQENRLRPFAAEKAFGARAMLPLELRLPGGGALAFRGRIDRIDVAEDGTLHVIDYKTGGSSSYKKVDAEHPDGGGRKLQLPVYAEAARALRGDPAAHVHAAYWFVTSTGSFARRGYEVTSRIRDQVATTLQHIVNGLRAGAFPHRPENASRGRDDVACPFCRPDGLGVGELERHQRHKRGDPALKVFAHIPATTGLTETATTRDG